ncbi:ATP-dependent zinc metalloprotease FtsH [Robinsoniella peoriensis]|uniref:ATP-dependent zinc metalloprotease FtsH n=1 Tax=Robinsoniella peoriensis TaxID=180332 RepID=UPI00363A1E03
MDNNQQPGNGPNNGSNNNNGKPSKNGQTIMIFLVVTLIALVGMSIFNNMLKNSTEKEITYNKFMEMVEKKEVKKVDIQSSKIVITPKEQPFPGVTMTYYTGVVPDPNLTEKLIAAGVDFNGAIPDMTSAILYNILSIAIPLILIWVVLGFFLRKMSKGGGMMGGVGKSKAKVYVQKETGVTFRDVAGQDEAKESLQEVVDFLENPGKYTKIGAKLPKGALLVGPPGTGKTLLAKAVAGEAHAPFFSLSGSDFVEMFVGVGASRVRDLFEEAKKNAPCIIFIDEIDAIGKSRDSRYGGGNDEREQTLNQLLAEMDGFDTSKGLLILAATNRPEVLDQALLRPGRFDRRVVVDKPDLKGRVDILKVHSKNVLLDDTVDLEAIALATSGAVGSDLANMINEAAILAVKKGRNVVSQSDLFESVEVVLVGKEKKNKILSKEERRIVSYHEVGHALVSALQKDSEPVQKITIVPRTMGALGYVMNVPEEEKFLNSEGEIRAKIIEFVAGRAAEELVFNSVTTGAANDIEQATKLTRAMITQYGMSETFGMMGIESPENQYLEGRTMLNCSDRTAAEVDREVMKVLKDAYVEAKRLLSKHRIALDKIAAFLIEKETITGKEFMKIFHEVEAEDKAALEGSAAEAVEGASQPQLEAESNHQVKAAEIDASVSGDNVQQIQKQSENVDTVDKNPDNNTVCE